MAALPPPLAPLQRAMQLLKLQCTRCAVLYHAPLKQPSLACVAAFQHLQATTMDKATAARGGEPSADEQALSSGSKPAAASASCLPSSPSALSESSPPPGSSAVKNCWPQSLVLKATNGAPPKRRLLGCTQCLCCFIPLLEASRLGEEDRFVQQVQLVQPSMQLVTKAQATCRRQCSIVHTSTYM